jgi:protein-tyrosine phosphatase
MPDVLSNPRSAADERDLIDRAVRALGEGRLVAFPTETVYGIAADVSQQAAVARLLRIKGRRPGQPLALAVKSAAAAFDFCPDVSPLGRRLGLRCWPGPLTLVLRGSHPECQLRRLAPLVRQAVAPADFVGLRVPDHRFLLETLQRLPGPLALTSANRSGQADAVSAEEVVEALGDDVDLVLSDGRSRYAQPSSVVRIEGCELEILRSGVLSEAALRRCASLIVLVVCTGNTCRSPMAQVLLQRRLADAVGCRIDALTDWGLMVISAGVAATSGAAAPPEAVEAMQALGLDLSHHESRPVSDVLVRFADVILTMTRGHREAILAQWPEAEDKIGLVCRDGRDVDDPIGGDVAEYENCARQIDAQLPDWVGRLDLGSLPVIKSPS